MMVEPKIELEFAIARKMLYCPFHVVKNHNSVVDLTDTVALYVAPNYVFPSNRFYVYRLGGKDAFVRNKYLKGEIRRLAHAHSLETLRALRLSQNLEAENG